MINYINTAAKHIRDNGPYNIRYGICYNILKTPTDLGIDLFDLRKHFKTWKHYSGHIGFPIPSRPLTKWERFRTKWFGSVIGSPAEAYKDRKGMWDKDTEYGRLRWDLLEHIIKETE